MEQNAFQPSYDQRSRAGTRDYDLGLRDHMLGIYRNMGIGLGVTAAVALGVASTPAIYEPIFNTPLKWVAMFAPLASSTCFNSC